MRCWVKIFELNIIKLKSLFEKIYQTWNFSFHQQCFSGMLLLYKWMYNLHMCVFRVHQEVDVRCWLDIAIHLVQHLLTVTMLSFHQNPVKVKVSISVKLLLLGFYPMSFWPDTGECPGYADGFSTCKWPFYYKGKMFSDGECIFEDAGSDSPWCAIITGPNGAPYAGM